MDYLYFHLPTRPVSTRGSKALLLLGCLGFFGISLNLTTPVSASEELNRREVVENLESVGWQRTLWPDPIKGFERDHAFKAQISQRPECNSFVEMASNRSLENPFASHQVAVLKKGRVLYEWNKSGHFSAHHKHGLWSASKTISATLIGAAMEAGVRSPTGVPLHFETKLSDFFTEKDRFPQGQSHLSTLQKSRAGWFSHIQLKHLLMMSSGFQWEESYESSPTTSSFLPMLYGNGARDMLSYALQSEMESPPGIKWNYSGGNTILMMGLLEKSLGAKYQTAPEDLLFHPLGMRGVVVERDHLGTFVGNSYVYMNPENMLRFGYLYLNGGIWNGKRILPEGWTTLSQQLAPALEAPGSWTPYPYIKSEGVYSGTGFWLNKEVQGQWVVDGKKVTRFEREFKNSPHSLFFAAGHYGQLILILPTYDMVIVRTGQDAEYWSKIDRLVASAVQCFESSPTPQPNLGAPQ